MLPGVLGLPAASSRSANGGAAVQLRQSPTSLNILLAIISQLFPFDAAIEDVGDLIEGAETVFADLAGFETSENDLVSGKCGDVVIVFARGTNEPGNVGSLVGPPFFDAVRAKLGAKGKTLAVQGVDDYEADITGFLQGGDAKGSQRMADLVAQAQKQCPSSNVVMSGYSQGGQVVHKAASLLSASAMNGVRSIVVFGDPDRGYAIQGAPVNNVLIVCHEGDNICDAGDFIYLPHLTYLLDADTAASFVSAHIS
ncbi:carbohydrate esterase family 5 protein [Truncatella angustata]|uniref:Cutinase n=1 Tax=Truncatella angustata TaxID=152316 RepID=A0A9P8UVV0_9PEZI|nr:carbohydrate esterase family 5 protein [Truncatella angustata]KAH6659138.1 carbohydrate esterase family 5 protein [Truncatella angustata]